MSDASTVAALEEAYDAILDRKSAHIRDYVAEYGPELAGHHVQPGGYSLPLRPVFLTRRQLARLDSDLAVFWTGLLRVFFETFAGDVRRIAALLRIDDEHVEVMERYFTPERGIDELFGRSDGFACDGGFAGDERIAFIEQNITSGPGGLSATDALTRFFADAPPMQGLPHPLRGLSPLDSYQRLFRSADFAGATIGYVDAVNPDGSLWDDDGLRFLAALAARGIELVNLTGREMIVRDDGLYADGRRIDRVYRGAAAVSLTHRREELTPIYEACGRGLCHLTNTPYEMIFFDKVLLAYLSDQRLAPALSSDERRTIDRILPWTRLLRDERTDYDGRVVDLPRFCHDQRELLVLKRGDGFASTAVHIGAETDEAGWATVIHKGLDEGNWIVQRLVEPAPIRLPYLVDERVVHVDAKVMICPFVIRGAIGGIAARTSVPGGGMVLVGAGEPGSSAGLRTAFLAD